MAAAAAYSYDHPRRVRGFLASTEKRQPSINDENECPSSTVRRLEESISRLEYNTNEKFTALLSRIDKCSELSVASSRAVAALSSQFDDLKADTERKLCLMNDALTDIRTTVSRVCSESQNLTMTALEDCCSELVKQIKANTDSIRKNIDSSSKFESELKEMARRTAEEVSLLKAEVGSVSDRVNAVSDRAEGLTDEMQLVAEESVNACLLDINGKVAQDLETFDLDWKDYRESVEQKLQILERKLSGVDQAGDKRNDDLRRILDERVKLASSLITKEIESSISEVHLPGVLARTRKEVEIGLSDIRKTLVVPPQIPDSVFKKISSEVEQAKLIMDSFSCSTVPSMYRDMEMRIAQCEHHTQQKSLELLKEFATEFEFDIDRMVELVHSVYVQGNMPMPAGTGTSWRRFKEIMFDKENFGGVRVRRPILDVSHRSRRSH